jgi:O-antigen/teichoic acid export membrane protein
VQGDRLTWSLVAWTTPPALIALIAAIHVHARHGLARVRVDWSLARQLWGRAWRFGGFAVMSSAVLGVDYIVMSQTLPADQIVRYNAASRVYGLIFFLYTALLQASWPVCAEAFGRGDVTTVRRMTRDSLLAGTTVVAVGTLLFAVARTAVSSAMLGPHGITVPLGLILAFGAYFLIRVWSDTFAMILMSRDRLRVFWLYIPFQAAISAIGQFVLARQIGTYGILGGLMLSFVCTSVWVLPLEYSRLCRTVAARP